MPYLYGYILRIITPLDDLFLEFKTVDEARDFAEVFSAASLKNGESCTVRVYKARIILEETII